MDNNKLDNTIYFFINPNYLSIDEYIKLQEVAALEYKLMQYRIFFAWDPGDGPKVFTSLN